MLMGRGGRRGREVLLCEVAIEFWVFDSSSFFLVLCAGFWFLNMVFMYFYSLSCFSFFFAISSRSRFLLLYSTNSK
ncbi:hypothetical protein BJ165DRAFT_1458531 [Panaeolus papilionaceus]|nr:hypothetical protein BJ165DRAFT_1458531 [Panaeolus papilionaceus]